MFTVLVSASTLVFSSQQTLDFQDSNAVVNVTGEYEEVKIGDNSFQSQGVNFTLTNDDTSVFVQFEEWDLDRNNGPWIEVSLDGDSVDYSFQDLTADSQELALLYDGEFQEIIETDENGNLTLQNVEPDTLIGIEPPRTSPSLSLDLSSDEVDEGDSLTITCSATDEHEVSSTELTVQTPDGEIDHGCGEEFTETDEPGNYVVEFSATDTFGQESFDSEEFTVNEFTPPPSTGGGSTGSTSPPPSGVDVQITNETNSSIRASIDDGEVGDLVRIETPVFEDDNERGSNLKSVQFNLAEEITDRELEVNTYTTELDMPRGSYEVLNSNVLEHDIEDNEVENVELEFDISQEVFSENIRQENLEVYRSSDDGDTWEALNITGTNETEEDILEVNVTSPGLSIFTVGTETPQIEITDTEWQETSLQPGEEAVAEVTLENTGGASGNKTVEFTVDGHTETREILVEAGETKQVEFSVQLEEGEHAATVNNRGMEVIQVSTEEDTETEVSESPSIVFYMILSLIAVLIGVSIYVYREDEHEVREEIMERFE